jgi:hypothetical protein
MFAEHDTHVLLVAATAVEYWLSKQFVHTAEPVVGLNVPATQAAHGGFFSGIEPTTSISAICM